MKTVRHILLSAVLTVVALTSFAQEQDTLFLHFDAVDYPILSEALPEVTHTEHLAAGTSYAAANLKVELLYPEYRPLSAEEMQQVRVHKNAVPTQPVANWTLSYFRRQPQLDIAFCPIVKVNGKLRRMVSCKIVITDKDGKRLSGKGIQHVAHREEALHERYTRNSVLSKGQWVRIAVTEEGLYEISEAKLKEWGFKDINRVKLFGYGGRILPEVLEFEGENALIDDLCEQPLYRKAGSVIFYAEGLVRWKYDNATRRYTHIDNHYATESCYFLTEGENPMQMKVSTTAEETASTTTLTTVPSHSLYDSNTFMWYPGGRRLFDGYDFATGRTHAFRIDAPGLVSGSTSTTLDISFSAANLISSTIAEVSVNGKAVGTMKVRQLSNNESACLANSSFTLNGATTNNNVTFTTNNSYPARLDYLRLTYPRELNATSQFFSFELGTSEPARLSISNADANTQIWELPHGNTPIQLVDATLSGSTLTTVALRPGVRYALVNVKRSYPAPLYRGSLPYHNQNLHADENYQMVIIVPSIWKMADQANRLAKLHEEHDSMRVRVVSAREIYNEFSSGTPDATAIRRYMKMLYDRAESEEEMPKYLIFFGMGSADNRMLTSVNNGKNAEDYLLCYEMDNGSVSIGDLNSYATEDYFGMLDDGEGANILMEKMDLAIGRLCCSNDEEARILVDKIEAYITNKDASYWKNDVLLMGDYGDRNGHMEDAELVANVIKKSDYNLNINKVYPDAYTWTTSATGHTFPQASKRIETLLTEGVCLVNYSGHGSPTQLSHAALITDKMLARVKSPHLPVWVLASCEIFPYDNVEENMGLSSMLQKNGGCIAFISPTRSVYATWNRLINQALTGFLLTHQAPTPTGRYTLGESLMLAKRDMITNPSSDKRDNTMNKMKFALIGDPAIVISTPNSRIVLDSINGTAVNDDVKTLPAGSIVKLHGHVEGTTCDSTFNGLASARIYDCEKRIVCRKNVYTDDCSPFEYNAREESLFTGTTQVTNGHFDINITIPIDITYSTDLARLSFYAIDEKHENECAGTYENINLYGTDPSVAEDSIAPSILLYFGEEDFPYGGVIGTNAVLRAKISDNCGINTSLGGIGHDMSLVIDNDNANAMTVNSYFTFDFGSHNSGQLAYPLENLTPGNHHLTLRVWDINNNTSMAYLAFRVSTNPEEDGIFSIQSSQNPIFNGTQLITTLPAGHNGEPLHITIHSLTGQLLWEYEYKPGRGQRFVNIPWTATTTSGAPLENGIYMLRASQAGKHAKGRKIIVKR